VLKRVVVYPSGERGVNGLGLRTRGVSLACIIDFATQRWARCFLGYLSETRSIL
jgi:hypothetical protein